jgi:hypothetical protein
VASNGGGGTSYAARWRWRTAVAAAAPTTWLGGDDAARWWRRCFGEQMKWRACGEERKRKHWYPNPAYIRWLTNEYRWACNDSPAPHIFVSGATSPTNICHVYSSVTWLHWWIYGLVKVKLDETYIHRCLAQTDEYDFIFVGSRTDEYNLNIFVDTDKFKNPDEWMMFSCSGGWSNRWSD